MDNNKNIKKKFFDMTGGGIVVYIVAGRGSGKSTLIAGDKKLGLKGLLTNEYFFQYDFDIIFLIHEAYDKDYKYWNLNLNEDHIIEDCDFDNINAVYQYCKEQYKLDNETKSLIIFEDCLHKLQSMKYKRNENVLDEMVANSRGYNISILISTQSYKSVSTTFRNNIDYLISFDVRNNTEWNNLRKDFQPLSLNNKQWTELWKFIFKDKYDKMIFDVRAGKQIFYKNFNKLKL